MTCCGYGCSDYLTASYSLAGGGLYPSYRLVVGYLTGPSVDHLPSYSDLLAFYRYLYSH